MKSEKKDNKLFLFFMRQGGNETLPCYIHVEFHEFLGHYTSFYTFTPIDSTRNDWHDHLGCSSLIFLVKQLFEYLRFKQTDLFCLLLKKIIFYQYARRLKCITFQ